MVIGLGGAGVAVILKRLSGMRYEEHLSKGYTYFNRYSAGAVFLARFVPVVRVVGANLAGITKMPFPKFTLFNAAGGVVWAIAMGSPGYFFGNNLPYLEALLLKLGVGLLIAICLIVAVIWISKQMITHEVEIRNWFFRLKQTLGLKEIQTWLKDKFYPYRNLVLFLGSGLLLAIFSGLIFGALAKDVLTRDSITLYDAGVIRWLLSLAT